MSLHLQSDDQAILEQLRKGEEAAIDVLFRKYYTFLCRVVVRVVKDENVAEDLAQEVFFDLWRKRDTLHINTSLKAYIRRAGVNRSLNYIRDQRLPLEDEEKMPDVSARQPNAIDQLETSELKALIDQAIDRLPERCRIVFTLSRFEQLSYKEISDKLGISVKTVENQISKALKLLRANLAPYIRDGLLSVMGPTLFFVKILLDHGGEWIFWCLPM